MTGKITNFLLYFIILLKKIEIKEMSCENILSGSDVARFAKKEWKNKKKLK